MSVKRLIIHPVAMAALLVGGFMTAPSQAGLRDHVLGDQTGCCQRCPACDYCCELKAEEVEEEKTCFEVESKEICIPRVVFPWQKKACRACDGCAGLGCTNCVHNGAKVRRICVLKTDKYKCPKCKYTWTPKKKDVAGGCDVGCCDAGCDGVSPVEPVAEPQVVQPPATTQAQNEGDYWTPVQVQPMAARPVWRSPQRLP